jgi:hypothetical protein
MAAKRASATAKSKRVFGQPQAPAKMFRALKGVMRIARPVQFFLLSTQFMNTSQI